MILTFIYQGVFRFAFSLLSLNICFDRGSVLLLWQNLTCLQFIRPSGTFILQTSLLSFPPKTGYPVGWVIQWGGTMVLACSWGACLVAGLLRVWAQLEARSLVVAHHHSPSLAIWPHTPPAATHQIPHHSAGLDHRTEECPNTYFKTVNSLSLHPAPVHKQLFWKGSSSQQLNPIHLRHEMPQAALSDWQETQWFPS